MSQMPPNPHAPPPSEGWPPPADGQPSPGPGFVTAPPKRGMGTGAKVLIGAGALAVVAIIAFLVLGGDDDVDPNSPVGAVQRLYDAIERKDCDAMIGLMSENLLSDGGTATPTDALAECEGDMAEEEEEFSMEGVDLDFALASQSGDTAVVEMTARFMGDSFTSTVDVVREDGQWKVDSFEGSESPDESSEDGGG